MKRSRDAAPSVTSLPQSPQEEANARTRRYMITMAVRILCFALMVLIQPYGWYTWVFGLGAAVLPYFAVVAANAVSSSSKGTVEAPNDRVLEAAVPMPPDDAAEEKPQIITVQEKRRDEPA